MNKIILLFSALMIFMFFTGCKAPACTDLSWGETSQVEESVELKYSAGNKCENISDYWDVDINEIISKIEGAELVINKCVESVSDQEVECEEFIPEKIGFFEITGCRFETPPDSNTKCKASPLIIFSESDSDFKKISWSFNLENEGDVVEISSLFDEKRLESLPFSLSDKSMLMIFKWTEHSNDNTEKELEMFVEYSVNYKDRISGIRTKTDSF